MYIKLINGQPVRASVTDLLRENKQVSFPKDITDPLLETFGLYRVTETPQPPYDEATSAVELIGFVQNGGNWETQWEVRAKTPQELQILEDEAERIAVQTLKTEAKATAMFNSIKTATLDQINTWIDTNFPTLNAQQRALLKVLSAAAGAYLRDRAE